MKTILFVVSLLMISFTLICGFWIKAQTKVEASSVSFHMWLALATVATVIVSMIVMMKK